jgi:hypothetical protein
MGAKGLPAELDALGGRIATVTRARARGAS